VSTPAPFKPVIVPAVINHRRLIRHFISGFTSSVFGSYGIETDPREQGLKPFNGIGRHCKKRLNWNRKK
jgi:hypothetical protein